MIKTIKKALAYTLICAISMSIYGYEITHGSESTIALPNNYELYSGSNIDAAVSDIGDQYRSVIFYADEEEKKIAQRLIDELMHKGLDIATLVEPASKFWPAEDYHQKYYENQGGTPYCHIYRKLF